MRKFGKFFYSFAVISVVSEILFLEVQFCHALQFAVKIFFMACFLLSEVTTMTRARWNLVSKLCPCFYSPGLSKTDLCISAVEVNLC